MFLVNVEVTMSGTLKNRLRAGVREIEIEGNRSDVDDLLSKWWTSVDSAQTENETENSIERTARTPKRKNRPAAARSARGAISRFRIGIRSEFDRQSDQRTQGLWQSSTKDPSQEGQLQ